MLEISRKKNESIVINDDIVIVVVEIRNDKVRLGIEHPKGVSVHRKEIFDAIRRVDSQAEQKAAAETPRDRVSVSGGRRRKEITITLSDSAAASLRKLHDKEPLLPKDQDDAVSVLLDVVAEVGVSKKQTKALKRRTD